MSDIQPSDHDGPDAADPEAAQQSGERNVNSREHRNISSWIIAGLGVWLLLVTLWTDPTTALLWNNIVIGGVLLVAGAYNQSRREPKQVRTLGFASPISVIGVWIFIAPLFLSPETTGSGALFWSHILIGTIDIVIKATQPIDSITFGT